MDIVVKLSGRDVIDDPLNDLVRGGAGQLIFLVVEAELQNLRNVPAERRTGDGKAGAVRNGRRTGISRNGYGRKTLNRGHHHLRLELR